MTRADKIRQSATAEKPPLAQDVDQRVILRGRRSIHQDSGSTSGKRVSIAYRLNTTTSNCRCEEHGVESRLVFHKRRPSAREIDNRSREIIDAFGLHPVKFPENDLLPG